MSDIIEKTLSTLPKFLGDSLLGGVSANTNNNSREASRGFQNFIKSVNAAKSKTEEDNVMKSEISLLRQRLSQPGVTSPQMRDCLSRLLYCDMMGHDVSFGYIHAVKLAQQGSGLDKRLGYLACTLMLHENHELIMLLVNTIQKDLHSSNMLDNCVALGAVCQLVNAEMISVLLPLVEEKLTHPREIVRRKAVSCLHKFYSRAPNLVQHIHHKFKTALCDKDPSVMAATLHIYSLLIQNNCSEYFKLAEGLIGILQQVIRRKLHSDFEYHTIPSPWLQIHLLRLLAKLGSESESISDELHPVLFEVLQRASVKETAAYAIMYECICTISNIHPRPDLLQEAVKCVGRFLKSSSQNYRYIGLEALTSLIRVCPEIVSDYQMLVVECLDDPDVTVQRKTLDLLCSMTNERNAVAICNKLLQHVAKNDDNYHRDSIVQKILTLANQFFTNREQYITTLNSLMLSGSSMDRISESLLEAIAKGCDSPTNEVKYCQYLLKTYLSYLVKGDIPNRLFQIAVWVVGELGHLLTGAGPSKVMSLMCQKFTNPSTDEATRGWILTTLEKLLMANCVQREAVETHLTELEHPDLSMYLKQRLHEIKQLLVAPDSFFKGFSKESQDLNQADFSLSFLDDFVSDALETGSNPYKPKHLRLQTANKNIGIFPNQNLFEGIQYKSCDSHSTPTEATKSVSASKDGSGGTGGATEQTMEIELKVDGIKKIWGRHGVIENLDNDDQNTAAIQDHSEALLNACHDGPDSLRHMVTENEDRKKKEDLVRDLFSGVNSQENYFGDSDTYGEHNEEVLPDSATNAILREFSQKGSMQLFSEDDFKIIEPPANSKGTSNS